MDGMLGATILGFVLYGVGIFGIVMFVAFLFKANKALSIWIEKNK